MLPLPNLDTRVQQFAGVRDQLVRVQRALDLIQGAIKGHDNADSTINATLTDLQSQIDALDVRIDALEAASPTAVVISGDGDPDNTTLPPSSIYLNETGSTGTYGDVFVSGEEDGGVYDIWKITTTKFDEFTP